MKFVTADGATIPALGFGTFRMPGAEVLKVVPEAIKQGFRHIDTAQIYGNEAEVGEAIAGSGMARPDIFLTTKVWVEKYQRDAFVKSVDDSLKKLRTDHVDLLLLHWPNDQVPLAEQIGALNEVHKAGKVRHIGVSNFNTALMAEAVKLSSAPLVTNQIEYHPYLDQTAVLEAARKAGMSVTAYYAMADGKVISDPVLRDIAASHGKTAAQVVLRWLVQQDGVVTLTKTATLSRLPENFGIFDFELSSDEMRAIFALATPGGRLVSPGGLAPVWDKAARAGCRRALIDAAPASSYLRAVKGGKPLPPAAARHGEASFRTFVSLSMRRPKRQCGLPTFTTPFAHREGANP